ncbi:MAG: hypothetical protein L6R42_006913, partial [Xanthoria sp. 1 TBL-2021]
FGNDLNSSTAAASPTTDRSTATASPAESNSQGVVTTQPSAVTSRPTSVQRDSTANKLTSTILDTSSPATTLASSTNAPKQPIAERTSSGSKAGIGAGVAVAVLVACGILYLFYRRRRRAQQTQPTGDDGAVDHPTTGVVQPQGTELKEGGKSPDPPPAYPYEKATPILYVAGAPGSTPDTPGNGRSQDQSQLSNMESSRSSNAGFYAQSIKRERSYQTQQDPDMISYHNRPEIDGNPLHEAPGSSKQHKELASGDITTSKQSSQSPVNEEPSYVDLDHLSKLEQEERQLQEDIAQIERLERLKLERDRLSVRSAIMALELDAATAAAILAIQLQDLEKLNDGDEDGSDKDATLAQRLFHEELKRHVATLHDHQIASCFGESPMENEELPPIPPPFMPGLHILNPLGRRTEKSQSASEFHNVDQQSEQPADEAPILGLLGLDRYAMEQERLSRKRKASDTPPATCKVSKLSDHTLEDPVCTACMSPILPSDLIQLSCDHSYCTECTMRLFTSAMTDETLFPPQCCDVAAKINSALTALQGGRIVHAICGTRTASWSVQQCLSIEKGLRPLYPAKLAMITFETSLETLGRIMRAYSVIPGQRFTISISAKTAATTSTSSFLNVQIVGSGTSQLAAKSSTNFKTHVRSGKKGSLAPMSTTLVEDDLEYIQFVDMMHQKLSQELIDIIENFTFEALFCPGIIGPRASQPPSRLIAPNASLD